MERDGEEANGRINLRKHDKQIRSIQHKHGSEITYLPSPFPICTTGLCRQYAQECALRGPTWEVRHEEKFGRRQEAIARHYVAHRTPCSPVR